MIDLHIGLEQRNHFSAVTRAAQERHVKLQNKLFLLIVLMSAGFFYWLSITVLSGGTAELDRSVLLFLHKYDDPWINRACMLVSMLVTITSILFLCHFLYRRLWRNALVWFCATAGAPILSGIVKKLMHRHRPELWSLFYPQSSFGFPSGHATESMAIVLTLLIFFSSSKISLTRIAAGAIFIWVVGLCRMYLGLHYPTDIVAGWSLALIWVCTLGSLLHPLDSALPYCRTTHPLLPSGIK